jgi:transcriptional regulator with XRE-family HTH domain
MRGSNQNGPLLKAFAAEVKARRGELQISQEELAFRSGLSRTFMARIETAQNQPTLTALFKIAEGLGLAAPELVDSTAARMAKELRNATRSAKAK